MTKTYIIEGMHCQSCVKKISDALKSLTEKAEVTLNPPQVVISGGEIADLGTLNKAVAGVGNYKLKPLEAVAAAAAEVEQKSWLKTYYPLFLIVGMISIVSIKGAGN